METGKGFLFFLSFCTIIFVLLEKIIIGTINNKAKLARKRIKKTILIGKILYTNFKWWTLDVVTVNDYRFVKLFYI